MAMLRGFWDCFTTEIGRWWPGTFCSSPDRVKVFQGEFILGGKLFEDWGNGNGWVWYTIYKLDSIHHAFRAQGMMSDGSTSDIKLHITAKNESESLVRITREHITGEIESKETLVKTQTQGWDELLGKHFKRYFESKH
ncbi:MAG: hypothetical protein QM811_19145 [Pirellulales bacterium]